MERTERRKVLVCSCERTMPAFGESARRGCEGAEILEGDQLCGAELDRVRAALDAGDRVTIACTQQAPLFLQTAEELRFEGSLDFVNIRETAGWSAEAGAAGPKAAALLAMAAEPAGAPAAVTLTSGGVVLILGRDETAIEAGRQLADRLDVTVLLSGREGIVPPRVWDFPVAHGAVRTATGHLGAFELTVDDFALPVPSSRAELAFGAPQDGAVSQCDLILDLRGGPPLFPAHELRDGYLRADPGDRAQVATALWRAADLVGEFDKPRYIDFTADLCAHSRSRITGCTRCLELCPTGAITPAGDHVAIDPYICAGCGSCAAACPTGAAAYDMPGAETLLARLRALLLTYREAGGRAPVVLFHDTDHGDALIDALARFGDGLPARVLPVPVNAVTQLGLETWAAALSWGATAVRALARARPRHDMAGLHRTLDLANRLAEALGYGTDPCGLIETDDPDELALALARTGDGPGPARPATFLAVGGKRSLLVSAVSELHRAAPAPVDYVPLPTGSPFGSVAVDADGCTLCLSCVGACPTGALSAGEDRPALYFTESACVQCGLCAAICPEKVISLTPQLDFVAWHAPRRVIKEEEPYHCIRCGTPFGTRSTVERIVARLEGRHWMFSGTNAGRLDVVRMCERCRIEAVTNEGFDPYAGPARPAPRTTDDYLRERRQRAGNGKPPA
jgi:ferredoxin